MTARDIFMIIIGAILFVISFFIPEKKSRQPEGVTASTQEQMQEIITAEIKDAKGQMKEIVDETISYSVEKAERVMERLTNEKISAVSEFSETVLDDINKNRDEVMFLYDMLNDKHDKLKEAVEQVSITTKQANQVKEALKESLQYQEEEVQEPVNENVEAVFVPFEALNVEKIELEELTETEKDKKKESVKNSKKAASQASKNISVQMDSVAAVNKQPDITFDGKDANQLNNNEKILEMHRMNKSNVTIAKELGLGVGEVKLVIDLYSGM